MRVLLTFEKAFRKFLHQNFFAISSQNFDFFGVGSVSVSGGRFLSSLSL